MKRSRFSSSLCSLCVFCTLCFPSWWLSASSLETALAADVADWAKWKTDVSAVLKAASVKMAKNHPEYTRNIALRPAHVVFQIAKTGELSIRRGKQTSGSKLFDIDAEQVIFFVRNYQEFRFPEGASEPFVDCSLYIYPNGGASQFTVTKPKKGEVFKSNVEDVDLDPKPRQDPPDVVNF